jgi:cytidylate kinase
MQTADGFHTQLVHLAISLQQCKHHHIAPLILLFSKIEQNRRLLQQDKKELFSRVVHQSDGVMEHQLQTYFCRFSDKTKLWLHIQHAARLKDVQKRVRRLSD